MPTTPKLPARHARKGSTTLQFPKLPAQQYSPRRPLNRKER